MAEEPLRNCPLCPKVPIDKVSHVEVFRVKKNKDGKPEMRLIPEKLPPDADAYSLIKLFGGGEYACRPRFLDGKDGEAMMHRITGEPKKHDFDPDGEEEDEDEEDEEEEEEEEAEKLKKAKEEQARRDEIRARMTGGMPGMPGMPGMGAWQPPQQQQQTQMLDVFKVLMESQAQAAARQAELASRNDPMNSPLFQAIIAKALTGDSGNKMTDVEKQGLLSQIDRLQDRLTRLQDELDSRQRKMSDMAQDHSMKIRTMDEDYRRKIESLEDRISELRKQADDNLYEAKMAEMMAAVQKDGGKNPGMMQDLAKNLLPILPALMPMLQAMMPGGAGGPGGMPGMPPGMIPGMPPSPQMQAPPPQPPPPQAQPTMFGEGSFSSD